MSISRFPAHLRLMVAPAFENGAPAKTARPMVALDGATGVVTRTALLARLEEMGELAPTAPLSFVVVKVSGLAQAGEDALQPIAARVRELIRATDVVGRLTGTTFGVALQGTGATAAGAVAARLTHHLNRISELHPAVCITVSAATGTGLNAEVLPAAAMDSYEPCCG